MNIKLSTSVLVVLFLVTASGLFSQNKKTSQPASKPMFTLGGHMSSEQVSISELTSFTEFTASDTTQKLRIISYEYVVNCGGTIKSGSGISHKLSGQLKEFLKAVKPKNKIFIDMKVKDQKGVVMILPTYMLIAK